MAWWPRIFAVARRFLHLLRALKSLLRVCGWKERTNELVEKHRQMERRRMMAPSLTHLMQLKPKEKAVDERLKFLTVKKRARYSYRIGYE